MNKKLKRMAVVGATVLMTASSVGFSNAMQVKKSCDLNLKGKMYVCINGKRFKLDLSCASIFDTLKWFNKNNCPNKYPISLAPTPMSPAGTSKFGPICLHNSVIKL